MLALKVKEHIILIKTINYLEIQTQKYYLKLEKNLRKKSMMNYIKYVLPNVP